MKAKIVSLAGHQMKVEASEHHKRNCDKCRKPVDPKNDAVQLDIMLGGGMGLITAQPRHLLPTEDCPGSPSRAQYLGLALDTRGEYPLDPDQIPRVREAYRRMQEEL